MASAREFRVIEVDGLGGNCRVARTARARNVPAEPELTQDLVPQPVERYAHNNRLIEILTDQPYPAWIPDAEVPRAIDAARAISGSSSRSPYSERS